MPPTMSIFFAASASDMIGASASRRFTLRRTFSSVAAASKSLGWRSCAAITAGLIDLINSGRCPGSSTRSITTLMAAAIAPQFVCPSTITSGAPRNFTAYSRLANPSSSRKISGEADHEDVTRTLIEHELGRDSAVGAAQHCNDGGLHDRSFGAASREVLFVGCVRHVTGVALH